MLMANNSDQMQIFLCLWAELKIRTIGTLAKRYEHSRNMAWFCADKRAEKQSTYRCIQKQSNSAGFFVCVCARLSLWILHFHKLRARTHAHTAHWRRRRTVIGLSSAAVEWIPLLDRPIFRSAPLQASKSCESFQSYRIIAFTRAPGPLTATWTGQIQFHQRAHLRRHTSAVRQRSMRFDKPFKLYLISADAELCIHTARMHIFSIDLYELCDC